MAASMTTAEIMALVPPKTHKILMTFKARNGKRIVVENQITYNEAINTVERAALISRLQAAESRPMVNWEIKELTKPFELGKTYKTLGGKDVTIVAIKGVPGYETVEGDDLSPNVPADERPHGIHRYNRASDRGRVTGSAFDMSDPYNLIPEPA